MPDTASASKLEYLAIKFFAEMASGVHLKNQKACGDYKTVNDIPSSLYVLIYEQARNENDPDPFPQRNFTDNLSFVRKYNRKLPSYPKIDIDIVKKSVKIADVLRYLCYEVESSKHEIVVTRNQEYKCTDCQSSSAELFKLKKYIRTVYLKRFLCEHSDCDYASDNTSNFRHASKNKSLKSIHIKLNIEQKHLKAARKEKIIEENTKKNA